MLLERLLLWLLKLAVVGAVGWIAYRLAKQLPPLRWLGWALRDAKMRRALQIRNHVKLLVEDRKASPDGVGLLCDVDSLVDAVADLAKVRAELAGQGALGGGATSKLAQALQRTDENLDAALRRLDDLRACLLEFAADRLEEALADARMRFRERAEHLGYAVDAHRELQDQLREIRDPSTASKP